MPADSGNLIGDIDHLEEVIERHAEMTDIRPDDRQAFPEFGGVSNFEAEIGRVGLDGLYPKRKWHADLRQRILGEGIDGAEPGRGIRVSLAAAPYGTRTCARRQLPPPSQDPPIRAGDKGSA